VPSRGERSSIELQSRLLADVAAAAAEERAADVRCAQLSNELHEQTKRRSDAQRAKLNAADLATRAGVSGGALCAAMGCQRLATMQMQVHRYRAAELKARRSRARVERELREQGGR